MKPRPFEYHRATSVENAIELLASCPDAKILAGGQSLAALMNFRLSAPEALIDINPIAELDYVRRDGPALRIGALTRHRTLETMTGPAIDDGFAVLRSAARWIGHYPIRTRGTFGGSLAHADPSAEWCVIARLLDAIIVVQGPGGRREIPAAQWFAGFLTTTLAPDEVLVEVVLPRPRRLAALAEHAHRRGDFGLVIATTALEINDGRCSDAAIAIGGIGVEPLRMTEVEQALEDQPANVTTWRKAGRLAARLSSPSSDLHATADYRRHLVATLTEQALTEAADRSGKRQAA